MKKILIVLGLCLTITACGDQTKEQEKEDTEIVQTKDEKTEEAVIKAEKKIMTVDVSLPISLLSYGEEDFDLEELVKEAKSTEGIKDVKVDGDTVTYTMTKEKHKELVDEMKSALKDYEDEIVADEANSFVKIENSKDFSKFKVFVDPNTYSDFDSFYAFGFYLHGGWIRALEGEKDPNVIVEFINNETQKVLDTADSRNLDSGGEEVEELSTDTEEIKNSNQEVSREFKAALNKAKTYSDMMHMSKKGIYDQLVSEYGEKFPEEAAQYAIDNLDVDYKENAYKKALSYAETMDMSDEAIRDQLMAEYGEQFTEEEANYAIEKMNSN